MQLTKTSIIKEKPHLKDYEAWLLNTLDIEIGPKQKLYYLTVANKIQKDFCGSELWKKLKSEYRNYDSQYYVDTKYHLFIEKEVPMVVVKPFESLIEKSFRKNVLYNESWPNPPKGGWINPNQCFDKINDVVRTCFVVKYLDGVEYFVNELVNNVEYSSLTHTVDFEAKEEGYYAAHICITFPCEIPKQDWDTEDIEAMIEIQVTTQLQEVIRQLLRKHYEERRIRKETTNTKWQWEYKSEEFATNYLGHILHYIEGMIMDVRDNNTRR